MSFMLTAVQFIATKGGTFALSKVIDANFGKDDAEDLRKMLLGEQPDLRPRLEAISNQIKAVTKVIKKTNIIELFKGYNDARDELSALAEQYFIATRNGNERDIQNASTMILSGRGVLWWLLKMKHAIFENKDPDNKPFIQYYSEELLDEFPDIYSYLSKMDAVYKHFEIHGFIALALSNMARETAKDIAIGEVSTGQEVLESVRKTYSKIVCPARLLSNQIDELAKSERWIKLRYSGLDKYLSGYAEGSSFSEAEPLQSEYVAGLVDDSDEIDMPQIFLYQKASGGMHRYTHKNESLLDATGRLVVAGLGELFSFSATQPSWSTEKTVEVDLIPDIQLWQVSKHDHNGSPVVRFLHKKSGKYLSCVRKWARLEPANYKENDVAWAPVITSNNWNGADASPLFLLRHINSGQMLETNGSRVYPHPFRQAYNGNEMKWHFLND